MKLSEIKQPDNVQTKTDVARRCAAEMIGMKWEKLVAIGTSATERVLDMGREIDQDRVDVSNGSYFIRLFKLRGQKFVSVQAPNSSIEMYTRSIAESGLGDWEPEDEPKPTKSIKVRPVDGAKWPVSSVVYDILDRGFGENQWSLFPDPHNFTDDPITIFFNPKADIPGGMKLLKQHKIKPMFLEEVDPNAKAQYVKGGYALEYMYEGKGAHVYAISKLMDSEPIARASISIERGDDDHWWDLWGGSVGVSKIRKMVPKEEAHDLKKFAAWVGQNIHQLNLKEAVRTMAASVSGKSYPASDLPKYIRLRDGYYMHLREYGYDIKRLMESDAIGTVMLVAVPSGDAWWKIQVSEHDGHHAYSANTLVARRELYNHLKLKWWVKNQLMKAGWEFDLKEDHNPDRVPTEDNNFGFNKEWKPFWFKLSDPKELGGPAVVSHGLSNRAVEEVMRGIFKDKNADPSRGGNAHQWTLLRQGALKGNNPWTDPMVVMFNPKLTAVNIKKLRECGFEPIFIR
jgi:hypothetical protein